MASISMRSALPSSQARLVAGLDIGTSRISCIIAETAADQSPIILGVGHYRSQGLKAGQIVNMDAVQAAILKAVSQAEEMAEVKVTHVQVNLSAGQVQSSYLPLEYPLRSGETIDDHHIQRLLSYARNTVNDRTKKGEASRHVIHAIPLEFSIDGERGIKDPRGMLGSMLGAPCHLVSANLTALQNLNRCLENCHLSLAALTASPLSAGQACLTEDERDLGTVLIDLGGGTTSLAVFHAGLPALVDILPFGGRHVTGDIANMLPTTLLHAERAKTAYGRAFVQPGDEHNIIEMPTSMDESTSETRKISATYVNQIISARLEEILEMVAEKLETPQISRYVGRRVVLTGGGALLPGVKDVVARVLKKDVRIGRPLNAAGIMRKAGPEMATLMGLIEPPRLQSKNILQPNLAEPTQVDQTSSKPWSPLFKLFGI